VHPDAYPFSAILNTDLRDPRPEGPTCHIKENVHSSSPSPSLGPNRGGGGNGLRRGEWPACGLPAADERHGSCAAVGRACGHPQRGPRPSVGPWPRKPGDTAAAAGGGGATGHQETGELARGVEYDEAKVVTRLVETAIESSSCWVEVHRSAMARPRPWRPRSAARGGESSELGKARGNCESGVELVSILAPFHRPQSMGRAASMVEARGAWPPRRRPRVIFGANTQTGGGQRSGPHGAQIWA
jgi:hypothetical protein